MGAAQNALILATNFQAGNPAVPAPAYMRDCQGTTNGGALDTPIRVGPSHYRVFTGKHLPQLRTKIIANATLRLTSLATPAVIQGVGGAFGVATGDSMTFSIDGGPNLVVTLINSDTTAALVAARINLVPGVPPGFATESPPDQVKLTSSTTGPTSEINLISQTGGFDTTIGMTIPQTAFGAAAVVTGVGKDIGVLLTDLGATDSQLSRSTQVDIFVDDCCDEVETFPFVTVALEELPLAPGI